MYENKKISKIVDEAITYLLDREASNVDVSIKKEEDKYLIDFTAENVIINEESLKDLMNYLNTTHREAEIEEYYWSLAGEGRVSEELALVAIMVDEATVYYEGKQLKMNLVRKI